MTSKVLKAEDIGPLIDSKIEESRAWYGNKLSKEREKVIKYYNAELPKPTSLAQSPYISNDVYDSVQMMKAQLTQTFSAGSGIIRFTAYNPKDAQEAHLASQYLNWLFYSSPYNNGESIIRDVVHDGLMARAGIIKVYYHEHHEEEELDFDNVLQEELDAWSQDDNIVKIVVNEDEGALLFSGSITRKIDKSHVKVEVLNPEEFFVEPNAECLSEDYFMVHSTTRPLDELMAEFPEKSDKIKEMWASDEFQLSTSPERLARFNQMDAGFRLHGESNQDELREVLVHECYTRLKLEGDERARLYKVLRVGNVTLEVDPCPMLPFVSFVPLSISHSLYGENFAARCITTQNINTGITRQILQHAEMTNNPRLLVKKGTVIRESELRDNRIGGVVNVNSLDGIMPMPQAGLNPYVFTLLQTVQQRHEQNTGISMLSQGLSKDAVSTQNSAGMIEQLVNLGQVRQKEIARALSETLVKVFEKMYELVTLFENRESEIEVTGGFLKVSPMQWRTKRTAKASVHLGYGERDAEAQKILGVMREALADPMVSQMAGPQGRSNALQEAFQLQNRPDLFQRLFPNPWDKVQPPQPDPKTIAEAKSLEMQAQAKMMMAQAQIENVHAKAEIATAKQKLQEMELKIETLLKQRKETRQDLETANRIDTTQRELAMLERAPITEPTKNIVSPNG